MIFYHATHVSNLQLILEKGLCPRTEAFYRNLLHTLANEYGLDADKLLANEYPPPSDAFYGLLKEDLRFAHDYRTGEVSLSGNPRYAIDNAFAGFEVELDLRRHLYRLRHFLDTGIDPYDNVQSHEITLPTVVPSRDVVLFEVDLELEALRKRDQEAIKGLLARGYPIEHLQEVRVPCVPPSKIRDWQMLSKLVR